MVYNRKGIISYIVSALLAITSLNNLGAYAEEVSTDDRVIGDLGVIGSSGVSYEVLNAVIPVTCLDSGLGESYEIEISQSNEFDVE